MTGVHPGLGRIEVSHRRVLTLAVPMMLSNATTPLLGLIGAGAVGRLGEAHLLGAVALGAVIFDFLFWTFGALRMATAGLTAQAAGAGDRREVERVLARALAAALVGLALIALQAPLAGGAFAVAGASEAVTQALAAYFHIRIWSAPFTLANYAILGSVLGRGRSDVGLALQLAINLVNIALTIALVIIFAFGVPGAAMATVVAEGFGAALGVAVLRALGSKPWVVPWREVVDRAALLRTFAVNRDIMIRTVALVIAYALFSGQSARAGDVTLAANAVLQNIWLVGGYILDGFGTAAETLCGQAIGARDEIGFRRAVRIGLVWSILLGLGLSVGFLAFGGGFIDLISTNAEVRAFAREYLLYAALTTFIGAPSFTYDGIFVGATWTRALRNLMLISVALYDGALLVLSGLGNAGLWLAMLGLLAIRGAGQALLYPRLARETFARLS